MMQEIIWFLSMEDHNSAKAVLWAVKSLLWLTQRRPNVRRKGNLFHYTIVHRVAI
jgi:hypothetical protein